MDDTALKYLERQEWSMGNGQCPECYGMSPVFLSQQEPSAIGHKPDCGHAAAMVALGGKPMMLGECPPPPADSWAAHSKRHWDAICAKVQADLDKDLVAWLFGTGA